jgi:hypothetical protein
MQFAKKMNQAIVLSSTKLKSPLKNYFRQFGATLVGGILLLLNSTGAEGRIEIGPGHPLPDYTKLKLVTDSPERPFWNDVALGDFNEDGRLDAVIQVGTPPFPGDLPLSAVVYVQNSDGTFTEKRAYPLPNTSVGIRFQTGDFNEDGHLDILEDDSGNDMILMLGNGDGMFKDAAFLGLSAAGLFTVADLNCDHHLDIVGGNLDGTVGVFLGTGKGTFSLRSTLDTVVQPYWSGNLAVRGQMLAGDVNGDKILDVIVASLQDNTIGRGNLDVFLGKGDGTFEEVIRTPKVATVFGALGDFNGDGTLDFAGNLFSSAGVEIWLGKGNGNFFKGKIYPANSGAVQVADLNHDGILDIMVAGDNGTVYLPQSILLGNGDGTFRPRQLFTQADDHRTFSIGSHFLDFNGDGWLDIISIAQKSTVPHTSVLAVALSHGMKRDPNSGFLLKTQPSAPGPLAIEATMNFLDWTVVATNYFSSGEWLFNDSKTGLGRRFYRARVQ